MYLPFPAGAIRLKSFWLAASLLVGLVSGQLFAVAFSLDWLTVGGLVALVMVIPGLIRPQIVSLPYRAFNKVSGIFAAQVTTMLLFLCFSIISIAAGKKESLLKLREPREFHSLWEPRIPPGMSDDNGTYGVSVIRSPHRSWASTFFRWAIDSGNWWMCALFPFLLLIWVLGKEQEMTTVPGSVYTLY